MWTLGCGINLLHINNDISCIMWFEALKWRGKVVKKCMYDLNKALKECKKNHVKIKKIGK